MGMSTTTPISLFKNYHSADLSRTVIFNDLPYYPGLRIITSVHQGPLEYTLESRSGNTLEQALTSTQTIRFSRRHFDQGKNKILSHVFPSRTFSFELHKKIPEISHMVQAFSLSRYR